MVGLFKLNGSCECGIVVPVNGDNYECKHLCRSILDENNAFLTTADSAIQVAEGAVERTVTWGGKVLYRAAFPVEKSAGANFYPVDMDKKVDGAGTFLTSSHSFPYFLQAVKSSNSF